VNKDSNLHIANDTYNQCTLQKRCQDLQTQFGNMDIKIEKSVIIIT
jgi:hypothetical protein